jgi:transglutaminase-like putative cysteine protease
VTAARPPDAAPPAPSVRYRIRHVTRYDYGDDVGLAHHLMRLSPRPHPRQTCERSAVTLDPPPAWSAGFVDAFGNPAVAATLEAPHRSLEIVAEHEVLVAEPPRGDPEATPPWEEVAAELAAPAGPEAIEACRFAAPSPLLREPSRFAAFAAPSFPPGRPVGAAARDLCARLFREFAFDPSATTVATPPEAVLEARRGVCQDFAHVAIGALRSRGLAARYVSGYLRTIPPPGSPRLVGADASHAWIAVWCGPRDGWVELDPTNDRVAGADHVVLAWGRDYQDVSPVRGVVLGGGRHALSVAVDVVPPEG